MSHAAVEDPRNAGIRVWLNGELVPREKAVVSVLDAGFLLGGLGGALLTALRLVDRKAYPFGPFMLLGAVVGVLTGQWFADLYTG